AREAASAGGAIPAVAAMKLTDGKFEGGAGEVGPEAIEEKQLRIGALPEEEGADALFSACWDQQVRIGRAAGHEGEREKLLGARTRIDQPRFRLFRDRARGAGDLGAAAITEGDRKVQLAVARGAPLGVFDQPDDLGVEAAQLADDTQSHAAAVQLIDLIDQVK